MLYPNRNLTCAYGITQIVACSAMCEPSYTFTLQTCYIVSYTKLLHRDISLRLTQVISCMTLKFLSLLIESVIQPSRQLQGQSFRSVTCPFIQYHGQPFSHWVSHCVSHSGMGAAIQSLIQPLDEPFSHWINLSVMGAAIQSLGQSFSHGSSIVIGPAIQSLSQSFSFLNQPFSNWVSHLATGSVVQSLNQNARKYLGQKW